MSSFHSQQRALSKLSPPSKAKVTGTMTTWDPLDLGMQPDSHRYSGQWDQALGREAGLNLHQAQECPPVSAGLKVLLFLHLQIFKPCPHPLRKETVYRPGTVLTAPKIMIHCPQRRGGGTAMSPGTCARPLDCSRWPWSPPLYKELCDGKKT